MAIIRLNNTFDRLDNNQYPLSLFYDILKSGERISNIYSTSNVYSFEKQFLINPSNKRKEINYFRDSALMLGDISANNDRTYQIDPNTGELQTSLEGSLYHINATLFNIEGVTVTSTSDSSLNIENTLKIRVIPDSEIKNIRTSLIKNNNRVILPNAINIEISRNLEIGKTITDQLIKVYNKTSKDLLIGDSSTTGAVVKIGFTPAPSYTAPNLNTEGMIDYEEFLVNPVLDPGNKQRNLWLLGFNNKFWMFNNSWLESETNQSHIQYLTKTIPDVSTINIIGESNILPAHQYIYDKFFTNTTPETITRNGYVKLATAASLSKFKYSFDGANSYSLGHESSTGKIDYLSNKHTVKYPSGYTEDLSDGTVPSNAGGLLGFIPKGAKITFIEDPTETKIKIVPIITNNAITAYTVYANEFIFD